MLYPISRLRILDNIELPPGIEVEVTEDINEFMKLKADFNNSAPHYYGTALRQGNRLQFATAMSVNDYVRIVHLEQAIKGSTLEEMKKYANRPKEPGHLKNLKEYLEFTACKGEPFILPAFIVNCGLNSTEESPKAHLTIYAGPSETMVWPGIFRPPTCGGMAVTDGGHRTLEILEKLNNSPGKLIENAISVIFVMEQDLDQYRQDFADCGKAKPIAKSLTTAWDRRDVGHRFATSLVEVNKHLAKVIDATSNSVNLSNNAKKAWSMSALHSATINIYTVEDVLPKEASEPPAARKEREKDQKELDLEPPPFHNPQRMSDFFDQIFIHIPILAEISAGTSAATFRLKPPHDRGGCVLLRGAGVAVLLQAYTYAIKTHMKFDVMAKHLGSLDWYVLKPDARKQNPGEDAHEYITANAYPAWKNLVVMMAGDSKFRLKGTRLAAENSFTVLQAQLGI